MPWRGVVRVSGADAETFLQNLITQDLDKLGDQEALWSAFLTPQGKYNHDFFLLREGAGFLLECESPRADALCADILKYRLRAEVELRNESAHYQVRGSQQEPPTTGRAYRDPRTGAHLWRSLTPRAEAREEPQEKDENDLRQAYEQARISAAWFDGSRDLQVGKDLPAEGGMDIQGALDWHKGCYLGQEVTTRVHRRGLLKHRLVPVVATRPLATGAEIHDDQEKHAGAVRSVSGDHGLAYLLLAKIHQPLFIQGEKLEVRPAAWQNL